MQLAHFSLQRHPVGWRRWRQGSTLVVVDDEAKATHTHTNHHSPFCLSVGLGHTLQLVFFLDGIAVAGALSGVYQLVGEALSNRLDVSERSLTSTGAEQPDSLVDSTQRRDVDSLPPDCSLSTDTGRVLTGTRVDDGIDQNLKT